MRHEPPLDSLDPEARANLDDRRFAEYLGYKQDLIQDGAEPGFAEDVLRGWIWSVLESEGEN